MTRWVAILIATVVLCSSTTEAQRTRGPAELPTWLTGQWVFQTGETLWEEHWSAPAGGGMMGMTRFVRGDTAVLYEFQTIERTEDNEVHLLLRHFDAPGMRLWESEVDEPMRFTLIDQRSERDRAGGDLQHAATFERQTDSGPQRIIYALDAEGVCEVSVGQKPDGAEAWEVEVAFRFRRVE